MSKSADWLKTHLRRSALWFPRHVFDDNGAKGEFLWTKHEVRPIALDVHAHSSPSLCGWRLFVLPTPAVLSSFLPQVQKHAHWLDWRRTGARPVMDFSPLSINLEN